jgi:hypothetical protein
MSKLGHWTKNIAVAAGMTFATLAGSLALDISPALALSDEEIARKLNNVPIFTLFNAQLKKFAVASLSLDGKSVSLVPSYVDRGDAERLLQEQRQSNSTLAKEVEVRTIPLSLVYLESRSTKRKTEDPTFQVVPDEQEVQAAVALRQKAGEDVKSWSGIPLFYAPNLGITLAGENGKAQQILPMYFSRADLEGYLAEAKKTTPDLGKTEIPILVTTLDRVLQTMSSSNDPAMGQVEFIPPKASLEFVLRSKPTDAKPANAKPAAPKPTAPKPATPPAPKK